jgi:hypothetical protein
MQRAEILDARRHRYQGAMLAVLVVFLGLIFAEVIWPAWGCGLLGFPGSIMGGNPFLAAAVAGGLVMAVLLATVEVRIDRESLRQVVDDERHTLNKLKAWRNAYFGAVAGLFVFVILSSMSKAVDMPFLLGGVMVSGAVALYGTLVVLERRQRD